jgi:hypothetical protein
LAASLASVVAARGGGRHRCRSCELRDRCPWADTSRACGHADDGHDDDNA